MVSQSQVTTLPAPRISFIGGGNMAEAILGGLLSSGHPATKLQYSDPTEARRIYMKEKYEGVQGSDSNTEVVRNADVVILAVKPQVMEPVLRDLAPTLRKQPSTLVISIAAGINTDDMADWLQNVSIPIVRCMPNTPCLYVQGAVGLYATPSVTQEQRDLTETIMNAVAKQISWVDDEDLIDSVTGISGSGPAYFFLIMEAMRNAGMDKGLTEQDATQLVIQTCLGAALMAQQSTDDLETLRKKVTSPKGTTEAAILSLENNGIRDVMKDAVFAAVSRGRELSKELGSQTKN